MEVCGGHTHTIYKHGIEDLAPPEVDFVHGPGCPVCVIPMGRVDDAIALAERPEVIFTTFGDMMRVPGGRGSLLEAKARGADVRMVYSPLDALELARRNPDREVVFFAIGFETTAPATAVTLLRARAEGVRNFSAFCNHVTIAPPLQRDPRLARAAARRVHRARATSRPCRHAGRTTSSSAEYGKPVVVTAFEPLDILQAVVMLLRQLREGRCEVENQYTRVVRRDGNPRALAALEETMELRDTFEWRGLGWIERSALQLRPEFADWDAEARFELPGRAGRGSEGVPVRRGADRRDQAVGVPGVRHGVHAGAADRHVHGLERGRLRRLLQLRARHRASASASRRERAGGRSSATSWSRSPTARAARRRAPSSRGSSSRSSATRCSTPLGDAALVELGRRAARVHDRLATSSSRSSSPAATSASSPSTERSTTSPSRARGRSRSRPASSSRRGSRSRTCAAIAASMGDAAARRRRRDRAGDTKVVERGKARRRLRHHRRASASSRAGVELGPVAGRGRATACSSRARSATTAWR